MRTDPDSLVRLAQQGGEGLIGFVHDYQTLIAGLIAIAAAIISARPVWRQLDRMSVQTGAIYRDFLTDRLRALLDRRKWLFQQLDPFKHEVGERLYEMREFEGGLNIHWVFERAQIARSLISKLETDRVERRDPAPMTTAFDEVLVSLKSLEGALDDIHRPHSTEQSGEDWSFTDEQWAEIVQRGDRADEDLDALVSAFDAAVKRLDEVVAHELDILRDRLKETDDTLLKRF